MSVPRDNQPLGQDEGLDEALAGGVAGAKLYYVTIPSDQANQPERKNREIVVAAGAAADPEQTGVLVVWPKAGLTAHPKVVPLPGVPTARVSITGPERRLAYVPLKTASGPELAVVELATGEVQSFALQPGEGWSSPDQSPPSQPVILPGYVALTSGRCVYFAHADGVDVHPVFCDSADLQGVPALDPTGPAPAILVAGRSGRLYRIPV